MQELLKKVLISAPNLVCVCVDEVQNENLKGRLYHKYKTEAVPFYSISSLLNEMERLYDWIGFPQAATRQRTFLSQTEERKKQKEAIQVADTKELLGHSGEKATFIVHVRYRQNATWQGEVMWAEKREKIYFRSALELIKLIDSALDEAGIGEIEVVRDNEEKSE